MSDARKILAANLLHLFESRKDSRKQLASRSGVALGAISNMASGDLHKSSPTLKAIEGIATAYRLKVWELLHPTIGGRTVPVFLPSTDAAESDNNNDGETPDDETSREAIEVERSEGEELASEWESLKRQVIEDWWTVSNNHRRRIAAELRELAERAKRDDEAEAKREGFSRIATLHPTKKGGS